MTRMIRRSLYTLNACEDLINKYIDLGGISYTLREGTLGLGLVVCVAENKKVAVINEVFLNEWSSGHTIRLYNKMPKKYETMIEECA